MKEKIKIANNANMNFKSINPGGGNLVVSNLKSMKLIFQKIDKIDLKNISHMCFFEQMPCLSLKLSFSCFSFLEIGMEQIKAFLECIALSTNAQFSYIQKELSGVIFLLFGCLHIKRKTN
jgi:hypothetical protein